ncbi:hypothetical protein Agabi119p4_6874 [Agaricus bisporus var. burnettii]|uniref:F-box domain-containing protein n=1 Tax=Agaricus bisporus var. burnettii TaxID=192524 RepID=A0A8H7KFB3_AGABI|nr:hypothetical protein Agabi119p4_6874 [Agaricus bisporus var. burnettii]
MITSLPSEILVKILVNLGSLELARISGVCRFWKALLENDTYLRCVCFKEPSPYFYVEGCEPILAPGPQDARIRFHPIIGRVCYQMGEAMSSIRIRDPKNHGPCLTDLTLQDHYATIPRTTRLDIEIISEENQNNRCKTVLPGIKLSISNPAGIRLRDFFSNIVAETTQMCDLVAYASGGICHQRVQPSLTFLKKAEILGKCKSYAGIESTEISKEGVINVKLCTVAKL